MNALFELYINPESNHYLLWVSREENSKTDRVVSRKGSIHECHDANGTNRSFLSAMQCKNAIESYRELRFSKDGDNLFPFHYRISGWNVLIRSISGSKLLNALQLEGRVDWHSPRILRRRPSPETRRGVVAVKFLREQRGLVAEHGRGWRVDNISRRNSCCRR